MGVHMQCLSGHKTKRKQVTNSVLVAMVTHLTAAIRSCDSHMGKELMSHDNRTHTEATQLMLGSLLASVLQLPSTPKDTPGDM